MSTHIERLLSPTMRWTIWKKNVRENNYKEDIHKRGVQGRGGLNRSNGGDED